MSGRVINTAELQPDFLTQLKTRLRDHHGVDLDALIAKAAEYDELAPKAEQAEAIYALVTDAGFEITDDANLVDAVTVIAREANTPAEVARIVAASDEPLPHTGRLAASSLSTADALEVQRLVGDAEADRAGKPSAPSPYGDLSIEDQAEVDRLNQEARDRGER